MACDFFPYTVLSNKSIGANDSLNAVFATDHSVIGIGIGRNGSVIVIEADFEVADLFAVHFVVGSVLRVRQYRLLRGPRSATEAAGPVFGVVLLEESRISR